MLGFDNNDRTSALGAIDGTPIGAGDPEGRAGGQDRLRRILSAHDVKGEKAIAAAQAAISCFVLMLHILAQVSIEWRSFNLWVVIVLAALMLSSAVRWRVVRRKPIREWVLNVLNVTDILIFLVLIWTYQAAYDHPAGGALKAPSFVLLTVLVALRALRFNPRSVAIAGVTAVLAWGALTVMALITDGPGAVTRDYVEFLTSHKILIGAEVERVFGLGALTIVLTVATHFARRILSRAAHARDYADALAAATRSKERAEAALAAVDERDVLLRDQNQRFDAALKNMCQGLCVFDDAKRLVVCNSRYLDMYDLPEALSAPGTPFRAIIEHRLASGIFSGEDPEDYVRERLEAVEEQTRSTKIQKLTNGRVIAIVHQPLDDGGWIATHEDITELQQVQDQIAHMAHHDALTDLPNRMLLRERIDELLPRAERGHGFAILCLDLDRFKSVNDTLGHPVGDELLTVVAERLKGCVRDGDTVGRLGGDEFAIVQVSDDLPNEATALARRVCKVIRKPFDLNGHQVVIDTSIGIAVAPGDGVDGDQLLKNADMALYRAKGDGRGIYRFFEAEMDARMQERRRLELDLRAGLERKEFELKYQPLISLETNELTGFEALLRWNHPTRGTVTPDEFIPIAEEIGLIVPLGEWVLRSACKQAAKWPASVKVAVNLSPAQFRCPDLVANVFSALACAQLSAQRLELEITEAVLLSDSEKTLETLHQLRGMGVRIAMDDFGTGYSSLSYLRSFPFDKIKIDGSFVSDLSKQEGADAIVDAVASLSRSLGMATTAEGVETLEQLEIVRAAGYTEMQGFLFSPPRSVAEIDDIYFASDASAKTTA